LTSKSEVCGSIKNEDYRLLSCDTLQFGRIHISDDVSLDTFWREKFKSHELDRIVSSEYDCYCTVQ